MELGPDRARVHPCNEILRSLPALLTIPLFLILRVPPATAFEFADGRVQVHGFWEVQLRALSDSFEQDDVYLSQWANILNLEGEFDIAPDGWGIFDSIGGFVRAEVRYECIYSGCALPNSHRYFGDRASHAPAGNFTDARTSGFRGNLGGFERQRVHDDTKLLDLRFSPFILPLTEGLGDEATIERTLGPVLDHLFAYDKFDNDRESGTLPLGPWNPFVNIHPNGALQSVSSTTSNLALRPGFPTSEGPTGLYTPSAALRNQLRKGFDSFDQNFSQNELQWNHGGGQDEEELKEAYLDIDMLDGRLWFRVGKQNIVWGKTELFRINDLFNPQDIGLSSLPSLEESRLPLWAVRGVYSFYEIGPLSDVRLEVAMNYDDFEPIDLGRCGEPYTVFLVCAKSFGLDSHGIFNAGLAGERRPPDPWESSRGIEVGGRIEFRWDRFSFAISDFYGYSDTPTIAIFNSFEKRVDPRTGRPLDANGDPLVRENALDTSSTNRQLFDVACSLTAGLAANFFPELERDCLVDVLNSPTGIIDFAGTLVSPAQGLTTVLAGGSVGLAVAQAIAGVPVSLVALNRDRTPGGPNDGPVDDPGSPLCGVQINCLSFLLTEEQEALLGCGPFYNTLCDTDGVDLLYAEASVLLQSFPGFEAGGAIGTRFIDGMSVMLPGSRGPGDPGYNPEQDGCVTRSESGLAANPSYCDRVNVSDLQALGFRSEMAALSANFATLLGALTLANGEDMDCDLNDLLTCDLVTLVLRVTSVTRPDRIAGGNTRFGRRDFIWQAGAEALVRYPKDNVLGFSVDFAEDRTKTNWGFEATWTSGATFSSNRNSDLTQRADLYNFTLSVDRPTFINFLNPNRTFFVNSQFFFRYIPSHDNTFDVNGALSSLGTLTVATGYFQDRLLPSFTFVHDFSSASGGLISQLTYRFNQDFSATFGGAIFYGGPQRNRGAYFPIAPLNNGQDHKSRTRYEGLSAVAERDELFLRIRYTF